MKPRVLFVSLALALSPALVARPAPAQPDAVSIDERRAVTLAVANDPTLRAAVLEIRRAELSALAEEDRYPLVLTVDGGYQHTERPSLATMGINTSSTDTVNIGTELSQLLPWGTFIGFRLDGIWSRTQFPLLPNSPTTVTLGPGYNVIGRLTVVQPLLRGAGTDVGEAPLRAARNERLALAATRRRIASELLRDVVVSFWELWYTAEVERIEAAARELAEEERAQTQARIDAEALPPVEIHPFVTRVLEVDESVVAARIERQRRALELGVRLGTPAENARHYVASAVRAPEPQATEDRRALIDAALSESVELDELDAQIVASRDREISAGDADRHRLDLDGWLQSEGLGNEQVPPAFEQFATFDNFSARIGLTYETPLTGNRSESLKATAKAATQVLEARREAVRQRIEADVVLLIERAEAARERVALAERTVAAAEAQRRAAKVRFEEGGGLAIEIQRAEDALRRARIRAARAKVDWQQARTALDHLSAKLIERYAPLVERLSAEAPAAGSTGPY